MALELAIATPFIIVMLLLVVAFGRVTHGRQLVDEAAFDAGRAASLTASPTDAQMAADAAATSTLAQAGVSCQSTDVQVDTSAFRPGGQVIVRVSCLTTLTNVNGLPGRMRLTSTSRTPLETYRDLTTDVTP